LKNLNITAWRGREREREIHLNTFALNPLLSGIISYPLTSFILRQEEEGEGEFPIRRRSLARNAQRTKKRTFSHHPLLSSAYVWCGALGENK
jgi:hypothetical protein